MTLNMKYWHAIFFPKFKTLIYELICVNKNPETIKNDNGAIAMCDKNRSNNSICRTLAMNARSYIDCMNLHAEGG